MTNSTHLVGQYLPANQLSAHDRAREISQMLAIAIIEYLCPTTHDLHTRNDVKTRANTQQQSKQANTQAKR